MRTTRILPVLLLLVSSAFAQPAAAGLIKQFPYASDQSKINILTFLTQQKTPEAAPLFMEYIGYGRNKSFVIPTMVDLTPEIRELCAKGLGLLKDPKSLPLLIFMMQQEPLARVKREIVCSIGLYNDINTLPWLTRFLEESNDHGVSYECVVAISRFKDDRAIPPLLDIMRGPYLYSARVTAREALKGLGWPESIGY
ncbi:MAG: HEAT repeat domain-containing protein [Spirochaetes bacterium]|nr:HEAT repeat domain-containing protein [Spirochaetota bacterium]